MRILLLNQDWFAEEFRAAGHEVVSAGWFDNLDVVIREPVAPIERVFERLPEGFSPDLIILHDNSAPVGWAGLDRLEQPLAFYGVDTHHHLELHVHLAELCDWTFVAHRDYIPSFPERVEPVYWLPLWASRHVEPSAEKKYGAVFCGTLDPKLNPDRVRFFEELKQKAPIECRTDVFSAVFPFAEIIVNQTVKGDLNFRVFEAMMCGGLLLTEDSGNGLKDLFRVGEHLVTYRKGDVDEAAALIKEYLDDIPRCRQIAQAGRREILAHHLPKHRAEQMLRVVGDLKKANRSRRALSEAVNFEMMAARAMKIDSQWATYSLELALEAAERAVHGEEPAEDAHAIRIVSICLQYDRLTSGTRGHSLLNEMATTYRALPVIGCARVFNLLNSGQLEEAREIAEMYRPGEPERFFGEASTVVEDILETTALRQAQD